MCQPSNLPPPGESITGLLRMPACLFSLSLCLTSTVASNGPLSFSPEQQQGSGAGSCLDAAAEERPCAASSAVAEPRTSAGGTEQPSWGGDAMPVELPVIR